MMLREFRYYYLAGSVACSSNTEDTRKTSCLLSIVLTAKVLGCRNPRIDSFALDKTYLELVESARQHKGPTEVYICTILLCKLSMAIIWDC